MIVKVLLVEDNPGDADLVRIALSEPEGTRPNAGAALSFEIRHVTRLQEALALLGAEAFDVVLLDLSLPDSSGPDGVALVHATEPRVPIVVLTGIADQRLGFAALEHGAQKYVLKGLENTHELVQTIRTAIDRRRLQGELATAGASLRSAGERLRRKTEP